MLGLAISLVAALPEKVWFCTRKGYAPWERPKREDVGTHEQGGHTIWYNEPELLQVSCTLEQLCWTCACLPLKLMQSSRAVQLAIECSLQPAT